MKRFVMPHRGHVRLAILVLVLFIVFAFTGTAFAATADVDLSSSPPSSTYGETATFTAVVSGSEGTPTGVVAFFDGGNSIPGCEALPLDGSGQAICDAFWLTVGSHTITAGYDGDTIYDPNTSGGFAHEVYKADTAMGLESSANPSTYGDLTVLTATLSFYGDVPNGTILFLDDGAAFGCDAELIDTGGQATCYIAAVAPGTHSFTAAWAGDDHYNGSTSDPLAQTIDKRDTTTGLESSANPSDYGSPVILTATVVTNIDSPTGTVAFRDGGSNISECASQPVDGMGVSVCDTSALAPGSHSLTAVYSGDGNYNPSTSSVLNQVVCASAITVQNGNDSGAGSLRQAIADVCSGGVITFDGNYTIPLAGTLSIATNMMIDGGSHQIIVDGQQNVRVFHIGSGNVTLSNLTILNGRAPDSATDPDTGDFLEAGQSGGGILNFGTLTLTDCAFTSNRAGDGEVGGDGGGIDNRGTLDVTNCAFSGNQPGQPGGRGGGISNHSAATVTGSTFGNNALVDGDGGAIANLAGTLYLSGSTLFDNHTSAGIGGHIYNESSASVVNSTFAGGSAANGGGAIANTDMATLALTNSTFSGNTAPGNGSILFNPGTVNVSNTIFAGDNSSNPNCYGGGTGALNDGGGNLAWEANNCSFTNADPKLGALADNGGPTQTMKLGADSVAIDAALAANCPANDQRGSARNDLRCDIGAYELTIADGMTVTRAPGTIMTTYGPARAGIQDDSLAHPGTTSPGVTTVTKSLWTTQPLHAIGVYWDITAATGSNLSLSLELCYSDQELRGLTENTTLHFWRYDTSWHDEGAAVFSGATPNRCAQKTGVSALSRWTLALAQPTAVTLSSFRAVRVEQNVRVNWQTANEVNVMGFNIWRKTGKGQWMKLNPGPIAAKQAGSVTGAKYTLTDKKINAGTDKNHPRRHQYKLELLTTNGALWSEVVTVAVK